MLPKCIVVAGLMLLTVHAAGEDVRAFGAAMPAGPSTPLGSAIEATGEESRKLIGTINQVCKKKGCWMVLVDGDVHARVTFKDYGFFVPVDSGGMQGVVYGQLKKTTLSRKEARHYARDAGDDPSSIDSDVVELAIVASAVEIIANQSPEPRAISSS